MNGTLIDGPTSLCLAFVLPCGVEFVEGIELSDGSLWRALTEKSQYDGKKEGRV
jgi:hypothetical protein